MALGGTNLNLRCGLERCHTFKVTAPSAGYTAGDIVLIANTIAVIAEDADSGDEVAAIYKAEKILVPCAAVAAGTYLIGAKVYADTTNNEVTETAGNLKVCGVVTEAGVTGAETVEIELDGTLNIVA